MRFQVGQANHFCAFGNDKGEEAVINALVEFQGCGRGAAGTHRAFGVFYRQRRAVFRAHVNLQETTGGADLIGHLFRDGDQAQAVGVAAADLGIGDAFGGEVFQQFGDGFFRGFGMVHFVVVEVGIGLELLVGHLLGDVGGGFVSVANEDFVFLWIPQPEVVAIGNGRCPHHRAFGCLQHFGAEGGFTVGSYGQFGPHFHSPAGAHIWRVYVKRGHGVPIGNGLHGFHGLHQQVFGGGLHGKGGQAQTGQQ